MSFYKWVTSENNQLLCNNKDPSQDIRDLGTTNSIINAFSEVCRDRYFPILQIKPAN